MRLALFASVVVMGKRPPKLADQHLRLPSDGANTASLRQALHSHVSIPFQSRRTFKYVGLRILILSVMMCSCRCQRVRR